MSEFKKIMGLISGSSAPRQVMVLMDMGTGDRVSTCYEKYAPKSRVIISVLESAESVLEKPDAKPDVDSKTVPSRSPAKDSFSILVEALLPDEVFHPIAEFKHEGVGTGELIVDDIPSNWRVSVTTKSKHSYSVFGY